MIRGRGVERDYKDRELIDRSEYIVVGIAMLNRSFND